MSKRVVIVGGGFAGLQAAKTLANRKGAEVILYDRRNYHLFQPLLYQVATAGLNPSDIAVPIRAQFSSARNVEIHMADVTSIDPRAKTLVANGAEVRFDYLLLACGARHSYFGRDDWENLAPGLKTLEHATEIRRRILSAFEFAENETDPGRQAALMTFVIVGGGPTGVELAGAIADISRTVIAEDFKRIDPSKARILLIEAGDRVMSQFSPELSARARADLESLGVEVLLKNRVARIDADGVLVNDDVVRTPNVFWAAGVQAEALAKTMGVPTDRAGRVIVGDDLSVPAHPDVFVLGDVMHFEETAGRPLPGLAPVAIQSGRAAARNILADLRGQPRRPFKYVDKGQMATIGKRKAIAEAGPLKMTGFPAWLAWLFIHILYLIGFKNRVMVLAQWTWSYLFSKRGARLITHRDWKAS